jgi:hypothetical protein
MGLGARPDSALRGVSGNARDSLLLAANASGERASALARIELVHSVQRLLFQYDVRRGRCAGFTPGLRRAIDPQAFDTVSACALDKRTTARFHR